MNSFKISFLALSRSSDLEIKSDQLADEFASDIMFTFAKDIDYENKKINIEALQKNTQELRDKIDLIVQKYKNLEKKIFQLNSYFKSLKEDEYFFFFPNSNLSPEQRFQYFNYLSAMSDGKDYKIVEKEIDDLFGVLRENYDIIAFDENTRNKIGEADKSKRICRFCGKTNKEVSFNKVAHAISEALGNKKIIGYEECDICNDKFGAGIENDLILYLDLYRMFFGIKGKNGIPKLKGKNFEIENNGTIEIKQFLETDKIDDKKSEDLKIKLETNQVIILQNIYRALSKYALSVIDKKYLPNFDKTIKWINGNISVKKLPKVGILTSYDLFSYHPKLVVYTKKTENRELPYAVAEFRFTFLTFVYIIPLSDKDNVDFSENEHFDTFWKFFKHYNSVKNWSFKLLNDEKPRKFVMNLDFKMKDN